MTRISSSLLWFKTELAYLKGQLERLRHEISYHERKMQHHERFKKHHMDVALGSKNEIDSLEERISFFTNAMDLHEVLVNADDIESVRPQTYARLTSHGGVTRFVLSELKSSPTRSRYTSELADALIAAFGKGAATEAVKKDIRFRLLQRLHGLAYKKRILRGSEPPFALDRRWFLP